MSGKTAIVSMGLCTTVLKYLLMAYGSCRLIKDLISYMQAGPQKIDGKEKESQELELLNRRKPPELWNRAFFFPDYFPDNDDSVTSQLVEVIKSARVSIQICLYLTSYPRLETAVLKRFKEGLIVQVVTCHETMTAHNNHFKRWINSGIPIKTKNTGYFMHNKFLIIDDEALLSGSLNWTKQGVESNRENVLLTTDPRLVAEFRKEFNKMWNDFTEF